MEEASNIDDVTQAFNVLFDSFDFLLPGDHENLGKDLAMIAVEGIYDRTHPDPKDPDGRQWPANSDNPAGKGYRSKKRDKYGTEQTGERTGQMLSQLSLYGGTEIGSHAIRMKYGIGRPPDRSKYSSHITQQDRSITDIEKAFFFRKIGIFYRFDKAIRERMVERAKEAFRDYIQKAWGP